MTKHDQLMENSRHALRFSNTSCKRTSVRFKSIKSKGYRNRLMFHHDYEWIAISAKVITIFDGLCKINWFCENINNFGKRIGFFFSFYVRIKHGRHPSLSKLNFKSTSSFNPLRTSARNIIFLTWFHVTVHSTAGCCSVVHHFLCNDTSHSCCELVMWWLK